MPTPRAVPGARSRARVRAAAMLALCALGCGGRPSLPKGTARIAPPSIPGASAEFKAMELPPAQLTRVVPVGEAYPADDGPAYDSQCLRCHTVSQTSFVVRDWRESLHARAGVVCSACHGTHEAEFVPQPGPSRCMLCHVQEVEEFLASGHGPSRSPGLRCVSCHDAHSTDRGLARTIQVCTGCHLGSDHVQGFARSRMGEVLAKQPLGPDGERRAPDCAYCHMPASTIMGKTGDFRNDRVTLHDPSVTVAKSRQDPRRLSEETVRFMAALCAPCHSERNARYRLEHSDPLILHWIPMGITAATRRSPEPAGPDATGEGAPR